VVVTPPGVPIVVEEGGVEMPPVVVVETPPSIVPVVPPPIAPVPYAPPAYLPKQDRN
jgi:hypothetical protein